MLHSIRKLTTYFAFAAYSAFAAITGAIVDEEGRPISGASIQFMQSQGTSISDWNGAFSIEDAYNASTSIRNPQNSISKTNSQIYFDAHGRRINAQLIQANNTLKSSYHGAAYGNGRISQVQSTQASMRKISALNSIVVYKNGFDTANVTYSTANENLGKIVLRLQLSNKTVQSYSLLKKVAEIAPENMNTHKAVALAISGDTLFVVSSDTANISALHLYSASTGAKLFSKDITSFLKGYPTSLAVNGSKVFVGDKDSRVAVLDRSNLESYTVVGTGVWWGTDSLKMVHSFGLFASDTFLYVRDKTWIRIYDNTKITKEMSGKIPFFSRSLDLATHTDYHAMVRTGYKLIVTDVASNSLLRFNMESFVKSSSVAAPADSIKLGYAPRGLTLQNNELWITGNGQLELRNVANGSVIRKYNAIEGYTMVDPGAISLQGSAFAFIERKTSSVILAKREVHTIDVGTTTLDPQSTFLPSASIQSYQNAESRNELFSDKVERDTLHSSSREFYTDAMLALKPISDSLFQVSNFTPLTLKNIKVTMQLTGAAAVLQLMTLDSIEPHSRILLRYPTKTVFQTAQGALLRLKVSGAFAPSTVTLDFVPDSEKLKMLKAIKMHWRIKFYDYSKNQPTHLAWEPIRPAQARMWTALLLNNAYMFSQDDYRTRFLNEKFYSAGDMETRIIPVENWFTKQQTEDLYYKNLMGARTLDIGIVNGGGLGGGTTLGIDNGTLTGQFGYRWNDSLMNINYFPESYYTGPHPLFSHELGHVLGYGHNSNVCSTGRLGPSTTPEWKKMFGFPAVGNLMYSKYINEKRLPVMKSEYYRQDDFSFRQPAHGSAW